MNHIGQDNHKVKGVKNNRVNRIAVLNPFYFIAAISFIYMARQTGSLRLTGTFGNVCLYKNGNNYYARTKSSLDGKRVKKDPAFAETMKYAELLAKASKIASKIYRQTSKEKKNRRLFQQLTGKAMKLLKEGKTEEGIYELLGSKA